NKTRLPRTCGRQWRKFPTCEQGRAASWKLAPQKVPSASANTTRLLHCNSAPLAIADSLHGNQAHIRQKQNLLSHPATKSIQRFQLYSPTKRCARQLRQSSDSTVAPPSRSTNSRRAAQDRDREIARILQSLR